MADLVKQNTFMDDNESIFFSRQLEYIKTKTYDTKYKPLKAIELIPVSTEADPSAEQITYRKFTKVGTSKIISDYADDIPRVNNYGKEESVRIKTLGDSYGWSLFEIQRAAKTGLNLSEKDALAARRGIDEQIDKIAWNGNLEHGIPGLINYPGITEVSIVGGAWPTKNPDQIVQDVNNLTSGIMDLTNGVEVITDVLLPISSYNYIANTRMTDGDNNTILKFILNNNPYIKNITWVNELKGAGVGGANRMLAYVRDPEHLTLEIPQPFIQRPPQEKNLEYNIICYSRVAGVIVYYPQSVGFMDGI